ncbi:DUF4916 domain-containing protein [Demequina sp. NBRC 110054]|uniref:DUF4916 domain-containing protein n=1 Tax=Demequina sp. NBRC 110054 TaxID=1570343 RepID=UPI000A0796D5|nr:DUF4916 domain-containing protein [Demequina sp. NBRC 110054]
MVENPGLISQDDAPAGYMDAETWELVQNLVPIPCADVVLTRLDEEGRRQVGLILRTDSPWGAVWCQIGGRQRLGESLREAAERHLRESVTGPGGRALAADDYDLPEQPAALFEFFKEPRPGHGIDPRKQATSGVYVVEACEAGFEATGGEATEFRWFDAEQLPADDDLWRGTRELVGRALANLIERATP